MATFPFRTILSPVDFSELSARALRYAAALAGCGDARLVAVYATSFSAPPYFTHGQVAELEKQYRSSLGGAEIALRAFIEKTLGAAQAARVETRIVEGLPVEGISSVVTSLHPDLIVMGTHGRSGVNRWMLGSVAEHVLRANLAPVLTVGAHAQDPVAPPAIRSILCPVNNSDVARHALQLAAGMAGCFGATVTALHVNEGKTHESIPDLCAWVSERTRSQCKVREEVREGEAATEILSAAAAMPCDLVVVGASHRLFFDSTVMGTTTVRVVRHAKCPVLTLTSKSPNGAE